MRDKDYNPVANTLIAIQTVIDSVRFSFEAVSENNHFAGLLLDDAQLIFDEYYFGTKANKWDRPIGSNEKESQSFENERISVLWCIAEAHNCHFNKSSKEELFQVTKKAIESIKRDAWREEFSEKSKANILCFFLDILNGIKEIPILHKSKTAA